MERGSDCNFSVCRQQRGVCKSTPKHLVLMETPSDMCKLRYLLYWSMRGGCQLLCMSNTEQINIYFIGVFKIVFFKSAWVFFFPVEKTNNR